MRKELIMKSALAFCYHVPKTDKNEEDVEMDI